MPRVPVSGRVAISGRVPVSGRATLPTTQNLVTDSEGMGGSANWTDLGATGVANATSNPFGGANGAALVETAAVSTHERFASASLQTISGNAQWIGLSMWMAPDTRTFGGLMADCGTFQIFACWNLATGATTQLSMPGAGSRFGVSTGYASSERESAWVAGWRRYTLAFMLNAGSPFTFFPVRPFLSVAGLYAPYAGDGASRIFAWGAQYARANWAGPYVRTNPGTVNTGNIRNLASV